MKVDVKQIWNAGRVRRWHMNPDLSWTDDYNDGHSARVARLWMALFIPRSSELGARNSRVLQYILLHDDEELFIGDMSYPAKQANPVAYSEIEDAGDRMASVMWKLTPGISNMLLTDQERDEVKFCDRLDAFLWMLHKQPSLRDRDDWTGDENWLFNEADRLGVSEQINEVLNHV